MCVEAFPDLAALSDADLKALTEEKMADERDVSRRRRELHGRIDLLRAEHTRRLKERQGAVEVDPGDHLRTSCSRRCPRSSPSWPTTRCCRPSDEADDAAELSDDELRERIHARTQSEREVSFKRRMIHGHIDLLRAEIIARLRDRDGEASEHLAASDVEQLSEILSHRGPPLELPGRARATRLTPACTAPSAECRTPRRRTTARAAAACC